MCESREDTIRRQNSALGIVSPVDFEKHVRLIISRKENAALPLGRSIACPQFPGNPTYVKCTLHFLCCLLQGEAELRRQTEGGEEVLVNNALTVVASEPLLDNGRASLSEGCGKGRDVGI